MKLSPQEKRILAKFTQPNSDINIGVLYLTARGDSTDTLLSAGKGLPETLEMQHHVGAIVSSINKKLRAAGKPERIKPGRARRTYALYPQYEA